MRIPEICEWLEKHYKKGVPIKMNEFEEHVRGCNKCKAVFTFLAVKMEDV